MNVAGASFNAGGILHEDSMEDFAKYSGIDKADIVDGEKFTTDKVNSDDIDLLTEKLGLTTDQLELYDMDTVAGLMAIAKAMQAVEEDTADDAQKELLTQADNFFSQLYACCLETTTSTDGTSDEDDTATLGAVGMYKEWLEKNKDKKDTNGKDIFTAEQKTNLEDKFQQEFDPTLGSSVFDVITDDEKSAGDDLETDGSTDMWHGDTVSASSGADTNGGGNGSNARPENDADDDMPEKKPQGGDHAGHNH